MSDKQPTQEQIKEFWEWCGFTLSVEPNYAGKNYPYLSRAWSSPDNVWFCDRLPPIDLNNLFKYAVPKVNETHSIYLHIGKTLSTCALSPYFNHPRRQSGEQHQDEDPALALFWAIWQVVQEVEA